MKPIPATAVVIIAALAVAGIAHAADNYLGSITTVAGRANCIPHLGLGRYAVQSKNSGMHVAQATNWDGGGSSYLGTTADTKSVLVTSPVLFDVDITKTSFPYICVMGQDGGAIVADVYLHTVFPQ